MKIPVALCPWWSCKYRNQEKPERMVACKLKSFYILGNYHEGNLEKTEFFQLILDFTFKIAPNQKTLLRCKGRPRSAMKWNHIRGVIFQMAAHSWAWAAWPTHCHCQQQQEMLNHTLDDVEQIWPWGHRSDKGWAAGKRGQNLTEGKEEKETARRSTAAKHLLNEEAMLCYSKRIKGLSCPNSAPTTMGSLINVMHFCQVNGA